MINVIGGPEIFLPRDLQPRVIGSKSLMVLEQIRVPSQSLTETRM